MFKLDFEIERLMEEIKEETSKRDEMEESVHECECSLSELQKKLLDEYENSDSSSNWIQKYQKQREKNSYLEKELSLMKEKMEALSKLIDENPSPKKTDQPDSDLRILLRKLEHEKRVLMGKLKDCEWRLDSESKELFKLNEKSREYKLKLNQVLQSTPDFKKKPSWTKNRYQGLPENQRIIDPRKGPIKKMVCVKPLPKITTAEVDAVLNSTAKHKAVKRSVTKTKVYTERYAKKGYSNNSNDVQNDQRLAEVRGDDNTNDKGYRTRDMNDMSKNDIDVDGDDSVMQHPSSQIVISANEVVETPNLQFGD